MATLRPYQVKALEAIERELMRVRFTLFESATGTGKTRTFTEVIRRAVAAGGRALVLVHRRELVEQAVFALRTAGLIVGIEQGASRASVEPVVVASVHTLAASNGKRLDRWSPSAFTLVVVDETHHVVSPSWRRIIDYFATARVLGVTATTDRADGVALGTMFASVAYRYGIAEAVRDRYLVPAIGLRVEVPGMDLSKVRRRRMSVAGAPPGGAYDLHPGDLGRSAIAPEAVDGVVGPLLALSEDRRTIVFAVDRAHARAIADALCVHRPGCAEVVHGATPDRADVLARHRAGAFQFLVNVLVLTEGYDDPGVRCIAMARPTQSRVLYAQACGRGLRPVLNPDGTWSPAKRDCLVLDFVGVSCRFSLVGPDDVLAGALVAPTRTVRAAVRAGEPAPDAPAASPETPAAGTVRFTTRVVDLVRRVGRGTVRAGRRAGVGAAHAGRGVLRALKELLVG